MVQHCSEKHRSPWMGQKDIAASEHSFLFVTSANSHGNGNLKLQSTMTAMNFLQQGGIYLACILLRDRKGSFKPCNGSCGITTMGFRKEFLPSPCSQAEQALEDQRPWKIIVFGKGVISHWNPCALSTEFFFFKISQKIWTYQLHSHKVSCPKSKIKADEAFP